MDPRVREHADTLVDWSARIEPGDEVVVAVDVGTHDLAVAVAEALGERGATPAVAYESAEVERAYLLAYAGTRDGAEGSGPTGGASGARGDESADPTVDEPSHQLALYESVDEPHRRSPVEHPDLSSVATY